MNEEEIKDFSEIINHYEYPGILREVRKNTYGKKDIIKLWNDIDDESASYEEYCEKDIAYAIVYLLDLYNQEKEKNKKYQDVISNLNENWVSKEEIKEKIEYYKRLLNEDNWGEKTELGFKNRVVALQELLKEER